MLKKLVILFFAMVITTTIKETYFVAGTWQYLLLQSLSLSLILFFIYHFIAFQLRSKRYTAHHERHNAAQEYEEREQVTHRAIRK
ncbi:hypothetical protein HR080_10570 [Staphylococcus schleiferi subsp. coagulans]|uniref:hypothetical protein n=1 Tax=Staphylococcus coagulans TaxID=74706 RepID=UPI0015F9A391|nr:hypothetical protein [Staphylococcus coagulans]